MKQFRRMSFVEAISNVVVGYGVAVASQILVFPFFGIMIPVSDNLAIGGIFSLISIIRSYVLRRVFEFFRRIY